MWVWMGTKRTGKKIGGEVLGRLKAMIPGIVTVHRKDGDENPEARQMMNS